MYNDNVCKACRVVPRYIPKTLHDWFFCYCSSLPCCHVLYTKYHEGRPVSSSLVSNSFLVSTLQAANSCVAWDLWEGIVDMVRSTEPRICCSSFFFWHFLHFFVTGSQPRKPPTKRPRLNQTFFHFFFFLVFVCLAFHFLLFLLWFLLYLLVSDWNVKTKLTRTQSV